MVKINFLHIATGGSMVILVMGLLSYSGTLSLLQVANNNPSSMSMVDHLQHALGQPASDYPVPDSGRMFSNDTARIEKFVADPYVLDMVQAPKQVEAGKPVLFIFNLFEKSTNTWLWHDDMRFQITDSQGHSQVVLPNLHGHGSVIQIEYTFPTQGKYSVNLIIGQQTGSPNFMIEPKVIREINFDVDVKQASSSASQGNSSSSGNIKDISMKVESWKFTPNLIEVNTGDLVRLHFVTAQDEVALYNGHGFGIEKYGVNVFLLKGTTQTVEFIADKPGKYTFRCTSFCSAPEAAIENHFNMVGTLVVNDANQSNNTGGGLNNSTANTTNNGQVGLPTTMQGSTTIIGNVTIPNTNGTATTLLSNATGTNATGVHQNILAQNVTSANAFTKENTTAPVSPTGISTEAERAIPPMINSTSNTSATTTSSSSSAGTMPFLGQ